MRHTGHYDVLKQLGQRIRHARVSRGMSQVALAEICGITFQQLQKYELGKNRIPFDRLVSLATALDTPVADLVADLDEATPAAEADPGEQHGQKQAIALLQHFNAIDDDSVRASLLHLVKVVGKRERTAPDAHTPAAGDAGEVDSGEVHGTAAEPDAGERDGDCAAPAQPAAALAAPR